MPGFVSVLADEKKILQNANLDELNEMGTVIRNSIVRRLTEDVLELPMRNELIVLGLAQFSFFFAFTHT
jgi:hypothetical protein